VLDGIGGGQNAGTGLLDAHSIAGAVEERQAERFFVAFDFAGTEAFQLLDLPSTCTKAFTVPDPDEAAASWMAQISMLRPDQKVPDDGIDYSKALATHVDVTCPG